MNTYTIKVVCDPTAETFRERVRYDIIDDEFGLTAVSFFTLNEAAGWIRRPRCTFWAEHPDEYGMACSEPGVPTYVTQICRDDATTRIVLRDEWQGEDDDTGEDDLWTLCAEHAHEIREDVATGEAQGLTVVYDEAMPLTRTTVLS